MSRLSRGKKREQKRAAHPAAELCCQVVTIRAHNGVRGRWLAGAHTPRAEKEVMERPVRQDERKFGLGALNDLAVA